MPHPIEQMKPVIEQARREGKHLWCRYYDIWFSPDELQTEHERGRFRFGPVNWELRYPREQLAEAQRRADKANAEVQRIAKKLA